MGEYSGPPSARPFLCYCKARADREDEQRSWRAYMAQQATLSPQGRYMNRPWLELVKEGRKPRDTRSAEEIIDDVARQAGLEVI